MKDRSDEKNRLWNEVLGKKRAYEKDDESSDIELTMDGSTYRGVPNDRSILKDANSANLLLGVFAQMITAMLLLDIVDSFRIGNPWFRFTLILATLFYYQFYSWKIIGAFNSGNWRIFFVAMVLYGLYQWISTSVRSSPDWVVPN